ncbi:MAG: DUF4399 domain-containing protein [Pseudomonadota bacterium]
MLKTVSLAAVLAASAMVAQAQSPAPEGAAVYIIAPEDGATVASPVNVKFGLTGMGVAPAGVEMENTGHHHLLINIDPADIDMTAGLPANDQIVHFGGGQTETAIDLPPGTHNLRLLLGDWTHVPHDPPILSEPITVTVQ